jgi:hypothetical protein
MFRWFIGRRCLKKGFRTSLLLLKRAFSVNQKINNISCVVKSALDKIKIIKNKSGLTILVWKSIHAPFLGSPWI